MPLVAELRHRTAHRFDAAQRVAVAPREERQVGELVEALALPQPLSARSVVPQRGAIGALGLSELAARGEYVPAVELDHGGGVEVARRAKRNQSALVGVEALGVMTQALPDVPQVGVDLRREHRLLEVAEDPARLFSGCEGLLVSSEVHEGIDHRSEDTRPLELVAQLAVQPLRRFVFGQRLPLPPGRDRRQRERAVGERAASDVSGSLRGQPRALGHLARRAGVRAMERDHPLPELPHESRRGQRRVLGQKRQELRFPFDGRRAVGPARSWLAGSRHPRRRSGHPAPRTGR